MSRKDSHMTRSTITIRHTNILDGVIDSIVKTLKGPEK